MLNCNAFSSHPIFYLQQSSRCVRFGGVGRVRWQRSDTPLRIHSKLRNLSQDNIKYFACHFKGS